MANAPLPPNNDNVFDPNTWIRILETALNQLLAMNQAAANIRRAIITLIFAGGWTLWGFFRHPWTDWANDLMGLVAPAYLPEGANPIGNILLPIFNAYLSPDVLTVVAAVGLPFWLGMEFASIYLADIFNLQQVAIARRFIRQTAFAAPAYQTLTINSERQTADQQNSPILRIGGPGRVQVNLEYAAVFERINGSPHFIRANEPAQNNVLEGFERLRNVIDLRDHIFRYDDLVGRTKDGIRITIQDIQLLFSIWRRDNGKPLNRPFPSYRRDIYWLTYQQVPGYWVNAMTLLVRDELLRFIGERTLGELLAAVGEPEIQRQIEMETRIQQVSWRQPLRRPLSFIFTAQLPNPPQPPAFVPRPQLSNFFQDFASQFTREAQSRGVRLDWINVGTWKTAEEIILGQHIEAWQLTTENLARRNPRVLDEVRNQARLTEIGQITRQLPILTFIRLRQQNLPDGEMIMSMLDEYAVRIRAAMSSYRNQNQPIPAELTTTLELIRNCQINYQRRQARFIND